MLGSVLHNMSCEYTGPVQCKRTLPPTFSMLKVGEPNLLVTPTSKQQDCNHLHAPSMTIILILTITIVLTQMMFSRRHWPCTWRMENRYSLCQPMRRCWCVVSRPLMRRSFYCGGEHLVIQNILEYSVLSTLSSSPIRCVTGHCGISLNCHRDRKVMKLHVAYFVSTCTHPKVIITFETRIYV